MAKKVSAGKTIFKIACMAGGTVLASSAGLHWVGEMAASYLPGVLLLGSLLANVEDEKIKEAIIEKLNKPIEKFAELGIHFGGSRIDNFFESYRQGKETELNFDLPRAVVKVWEEALGKMLGAQRDRSLLRLNSDAEFEKARKELLTFWLQKLHKAQSDNDLLQEFFGETPDYFLEIEKGNVSFIEALPDQKDVDGFFWDRIEDSFTNWAKNEGKFPEDWRNSIHQDLTDELKQKLFQNFSSALKKELKENERAWKSFEFATSLQMVSMLQELAAQGDQIKDDTSDIKKGLVELNTILPLMMQNVLTRFDALENTVKKVFTSNQNTNGLLVNFRKEVNEKLDKIEDYTRQTVETTKAIEAGIRVIFSLLEINNKKESKTPDQLEKDRIPPNDTDVISYSILTDLIESELVTMLSYRGFTQAAHLATIDAIRQNESLQKRLTSADISKLNLLLQQEFSTSFLRGAVDENVRNRIRRSLSGPEPIVVAASCMMLGTMAILYYLKHQEGYNIIIAHAFPHAIELAKQITSRTIEPPDAVVVSLATVPPLLNHYIPRLLMPPNPHRTIVAKKNKNRTQLSEGEFLFSMDDQSTALYEWETLSRSRTVNPNRSRSFHLEPEQVLSDLSDDRNEQRYILWTPIWQLILHLGIGVAIDEPYWFDAVMFFDKQFDKSPASRDLAHAIRHAWLELLHNKSARHTAIHHMLSDKDYLDNLRKFTGISDLRGGE